MSADRKLRDLQYAVRKAVNELKHGVPAVVEHDDEGDFIQALDQSVIDEIAVDLADALRESEAR